MKKFIKIIWLLFLFIIIIFLFWIKNNKYQKNEILVENTEWKLTQFGDNVGGQMMCFTIEGNENGLIIIDGGYKDNQEQYDFLISKISNHNNIVDSWIITHFDPDHGGQFVRIAKENDISIKNVYVPDTPTDMGLLKENAPYEDEWYIYEEYLAMDLPQKVKVHSGDMFEIVDLKMEVLCSYEDWIDEKENNLLNNGSIVFKLYGNEKSLLFCGDVQSSVIGEYLIENCKDKLRSDYLQVGHHGNNWLGDEFYKIVSPKIAFFAAPDWLMNNEKNVSWYRVKEIKELLEELGAEILWHNTSPNELVFK